MRVYIRVIRVYRLSRQPFDIESLFFQQRGQPSRNDRTVSLRGQWQIGCTSCQLGEPVFHALFTVSRVMQTTNFCVYSFHLSCVCNELSLSMIEGKRSILLHRRTNSKSKKLWDRFVSGKLAGASTTVICIQMHAWQVATRRVVSRTLVVSLASHA